MYFERKEYLNKLISAEGNGMIKIITGIRRCGKLTWERGCGRPYHTGNTHIMENVIYNELRKQGYGVDVGVVESFKRDEEGKIPTIMRRAS